MKHREWRERAGRGPWDDEPDKVRFRAHGLTCICWRGPLGAWCGYVAVPKGSILDRLDYSSCPISCNDTWCNHRPESLFSVHGGITFSGHRDGSLWYFGFDCSHYGDKVPALLSFYRTDHGDYYWTVDAVRRETAQLAEQISEWSISQLFWRQTTPIFQRIRRIEQQVPWMPDMWGMFDPAPSQICHLIQEAL